MTPLPLFFVPHAEISFRKSDLQMWEPEFKVPHDIRGGLLCRFRNYPLVIVRIIALRYGKTECFIDPNLKQFSLDGEIRLDADEKLILKT